ncbi:MAG: hypothetical protein HY234_13625 [Acidobacteria bacterium]|nr:hypothetical protein [Acidobacteriota bacterium]
MSVRCTFRLDNGKFCHRWARKGAPFCSHHTPASPPAESGDSEENLSPLDRLNTHDDLFDVVRESLNAIRLGRLSPGRAYATGYFIDLWMRIKERMEKAGPETKKFQKRRMLSDPVEQAIFDVVAEKVIHVMTGRTIEEIERDGGQVTPQGQPHWTERPLAVIDEMLGARGAPAPPSPGESAPTDPRDSSTKSPLPKNWGYEKEEKKEEPKK